MVSLKGVILNNEEIIHDLNFLLITIKKGKSNNLSNQKQEGRFVVEPNQKKELSEIKMNLSPGDELKSYLFIRDELNNSLIAKDSIFLQYDGNDIKLNQYTNQPVQIKTNEFILRGLVVDQTKTKGGRDFFDLFYSKYNLLSEKFPFVTTITEVPGIGRNSIIQIEDADKILYSFRVTPNEDFLVSQVEFTLRRLNQYYNEIKFIKDQISAP
ncbi:curli production assembly/transport protein CsgE [Faecalibacter bovis]|uniref:Curli production assembly/transport component CsgE n=1 Tax=Faecalibacter bovis TaxID=2898187 RepID=A0ABX7XBN0_9FLAO|nr:curli production assembly/transport protein CsgE [Faecalibacter bovis]MBS7334120.1 hypothetical protein [Weeksellaceae bacterium]QTV05288.1 hypothetical protein J9309_10950 [Faecalibacter bovis]